MPGPAITEGDRPPTNPAIIVRFPPKVDGFFFRVRGRNYTRPRLIRNILFSEKSDQRHLLDNIGKRSLHSLSVRKRNVPSKIGPMTSTS